MLTGLCSSLDAGGVLAAISDGRARLAAVTGGAVDLPFQGGNSGSGCISLG